ncbi:MAG: peptide chain release factor 1 [Phycisphaeraceae bacterium]
MADITDKLVGRLETTARQFDEIERQLVDPEVVVDHERVRELSVKRAAIDDLVRHFRQWQSLRRQIAEHEQIIAEGGDAELAALAREELPDLRQQAGQLMDAIASDMVTADDRSVGSVMLELRAGAGGAEAGLWAGDLLGMYQRFAVRRGWSYEMLDLSEGDMGGIRQAVANVKGNGVWQGLGYEGGVHCVKRVPATEAQGRVHTSTATVAVLPEPEKVQIVIPDSDVKMDITTAQGPGGQNVNKVATAVKMVHVPTGIEVRMQESKSQQQNRVKAWALLRARVYDHYQRQKDAQRAQNRSRMIGSGDRSERIRTYRYKESIVVDHRLEQMSFNLASVLQGELDPIVAALIAQDRAQRLAAL